MLARTGVAGCPESYFHRPSVAAWAQGLGLDPHTPLPAVIRAARAAGRGETSLTGLRLMRRSFGFLQARLQELHPNAAGDAARLRAAFGRVGYIHLCRRDKIAQAVSVAMAEQTGLWHLARDGTEVERTAPSRSPRYDPGAIMHHLDTLRRDDVAWGNWFDRAGLSPLRIAYETLAARPNAVLADVLAHLDLDPARADGIKPDLARLANPRSARWIARFRAEYPHAAAGGAQ